MREPRLCLFDKFSGQSFLWPYFRAPVVKTDSEETHWGGCILISPVGEIPGDLYQETDIIPTDEYPLFTKKLTVYGITMIGRDDSSDDFMRKVVKTIKEMFPQGGLIDDTSQKEVLRNMYRHRAVIPFFKNGD